MTLQTTLRKTGHTALIVALVAALSVGLLGGSAVPSHAATDGDWETYDNGDGTVTINGYYGPGGDVTIPAVASGSPVTGLASWLFKDYTSITSVTIPAGVTTIGARAFENTRITSVTIPSTVQTLGSGVFRMVPTLQTITFEPGSTVTTIPFTFCSDCTALTSIDMPSTVTSIAAYAYSNTTSVESINLPSGITAIGDMAFSGTTSLNQVFVAPTSLATLGESAFQSSGITGLVLNEGLQTIGPRAFTDNAAMVGNLALPSSLTAIGDEAFANTGLSGTLDVPASITTVPAAAFSGSKFTGLALHEGLQTIQHDAFRGNLIAGTVTIPDSVTSLPTDPFSSVGGQFATNQITEVIIGSNVTDIPASAFEGNLIDTIQWNPAGGLTSIGFRAFWDNRMVDVSIPDGVLSIATEAFTWNRLLSATVPASISSISTQAFGTQSWHIAGDPLNPGYAGWFDQAGGFWAPGWNGAAADFADLYGVGGTYYTAWTPLQWTYHGNGGTFQTWPTPVNDLVETIEWGSTVTYPSYFPVRPGYMWLGYTTDEAGTSPYFDFESGATVQGPADLYAQWAVRPYYVYFNPNGGDASVPNQEIAAGGYVTPVSAGVRHLSRFLGWNGPGNVRWSYLTPVNADMLLSAV